MLLNARCSAHLSVASVHEYGGTMAVDRSDLTVAKPNRRRTTTSDCERDDSTVDLSMSNKKTELSREGRACKHLAAWAQSSRSLQAGPSIPTVQCS
jgi:hypothetical protein